MASKKFTQEEMDIIRQNPYIVSVSPTKLTYSLAFKEFSLAKAEQGFKSTEIFHMAGLDPELMGKPRMKAALKKFKLEAKSPEGLREPKGKSRDERIADFAKTDLEKKHTKTAIRELQQRVVHLEQQIEFLKKIQSPGQ